MPRKYANIKCNIWRRADFYGMGVEAQLLYFLLRTLPETSRCGVTLLVPDRWVTYINMPLDQVLGGLDMLVDREIAYVDAETREVFLPDGMRHEQLDKQPRLLERAIRDAEVVRSKTLLKQIMVELKALNVPRASEAVAWLEIGVPVPLNPAFRNKHATVDRCEIKRMRGAFGDSAGRLRLRSEIAAGLHVCPCGEMDNLQVDHIHPLARGGTNEFSNLQVLCAACNIAKGAS